MFDIHLQIPETTPEGRFIEQVVAQQNVTPVEAVRRALRMPSQNMPVQEARTSIQRPASFFGVIKHGYGSPEAADRAIEEMRNEW